jgi:hypothetical protein
MEDEWLQWMDPLPLLVPAIMASMVAAHTFAIVNMLAARSRQPPHNFINTPLIAI